MSNPNNYAGTDSNCINSAIKEIFGEAKEMELPLAFSHSNAAKERYIPIQCGRIAANMAIGILQAVFCETIRICANENNITFGISS